MNPVAEMLAMGGLVLSIVAGTWRMSNVISKLESKVNELLQSNLKQRKHQKKLTRRVETLERKVTQ